MRAIEVTVTSTSTRPNRYGRSVREIFPSRVQRPIPGDAGARRSSTRFSSSLICTRDSEMQPTSLDLEDSRGDPW